MKKLHRDRPSHIFVLIGPLDFQEDVVSCSSVHVLLAYPTNPWVDWERASLLNFHDSVLVTVFLRHSELVVVLCKRNRFTGVCVVSVCAGSLGGWDDEAGSLSRSETGFVSLSPCAVPSRTVSGSWYTLRVVTGGFRPYFRRYSYRRASHRTRCLFACADSHALHLGVGVHLSRTSASSPSGLRCEGVALSLMTSEPLFSFSTGTDHSSPVDAQGSNGEKYTFDPEWQNAHGIGHGTETKRSPGPSFHESRTAYIHANQARPAQ